MAHDDTTGNPRAARSPLKFELLLALALLGFGLLLLPALIYVTGTVLLGAYGGGDHLGSFYGDYFRDLVQGSTWTWLLVVGPYALVQLGRLLFFNFRTTTPDNSSHPTPKASGTRQAVETRERREPTLKL